MMSNSAIGTTSQIQGMAAEKRDGQLHQFGNDCGNALRGGTG
jgi:hypothetical protein